MVRLDWRRGRPRGAPDRGGGGLTQHYRVPETAIRIATNRPIAALAPVSALLAATDAAD